MSATRDKTQKIAFVYSNLYHVYKKGKSAAATLPKMAKGQVLKAEDLAKLAAEAATSTTFAAVQVKTYAPVSLLLKRIQERSEKAAATPIPSSSPMAPIAKLKPQSTQAPDSANHPANAQLQALGSLKENLKSLNELHARLRFMLKELEDLVKD